MKMRTVIAMVAACFAYILLILPLTRVRAQAPAAPQRSRPVLPAVPTLPTVPNLPAMPVLLDLPTVPEALAQIAIPAEPAVPMEPAAPAWGEHVSGSRHWSDGPAADCSDLHIRLNDERPTIEAEERTVTKGQASVLQVREIQNGGVQVQGWDKDTYSVTACKAAVGGDAARLLSEIKLAVQGGELSVKEPHGDDEDWTVYLLIRTPRTADIEVTTHNGPVSFYSVDGKITTRATNGPISMKDCSGEADISAENGPISFSGTSGKLRLHTQNGPITVSLGSNWDGPELVADAVNGPLTLRVPSGFRSSFLVESNGHSPVSCRASICSDARKTWDDEHRRIEYGSGSPVIRLSTENGPISVAD
jgi:hypothetical protein